MVNLLLLPIRIRKYTVLPQSPRVNDSQPMPQSPPNTQPAVRPSRSSRFSGRAVLVCSLTLVCGCFSPMHTRLPTWNTGYPRSEATAFQQQDPFPDPSIGPNTSSRPLGFVQPRTPERKAAEQRLFQGLPAVPEYIPNGAPRGGLSSPRTVN